MHMKISREQNNSDCFCLANGISWQRDNRHVQLDDTACMTSLSKICTTNLPVDAEQQT